MFSVKAESITVLNLITRRLCVIGENVQPIKWGIGNFIGANANNNNDLKIVMLKIVITLIALIDLILKIRKVMNQTWK